MHKIITMPFLKKSLFLASLVVFILCSSVASAQVTQLGDQIGKPKQQKTVIDKDSMKIVYFHDHLDSLNTTSYYPIDTLITGLQHYHPNFQPENPMASQ